MSRSVRTSLAVAGLALAAGLFVPGCSSNEPAPPAQGPMGGAMESGKMQGGEMAPGKMESGKMESGKMEPGGT